MMMDWSITPTERQRHSDQFNSLCPVGGYVNGAQAKGFFMQSKLPPIVLAQIWGLADMDGDGRMNFNEFSVACKLITNKLKGFELPATLPPGMMMPQPPHLPPTSLPVVGGAMPTPAIQQPLGMPVMRMMPAQQPVTLMQPVTSMMQPVSSMIPQQPMMAPQQPMMAAPVSVAPMMHHPVPISVAAPTLPAIPLSGSSTPQLTTMEWVVPAPTRAKYGATFNQTDRARTGFLAGAQARNILLQSGLPQNILAQIWTLSDVDGDGRLTIEEFILSGYLCDQAQKGEPLPNVLPPNMIPPSLRKLKDGIGILPVSASSGGGGGSAGTPSSVKSGSEELNSPSTFEDKRRENFNKGQAELERRRQSIIDQQKKEEEERKKKEKEEAEEREKQKRELERQRLAEWEAQRKSELVQHRQREQEKVLFFKAKQENLNSELGAKREKVKTLTSDISETRTGVTDVKSFIDGMRTSRDSKMAEMNALKAQLKDQNARLITVTQEKAKLEAKTKLVAAKIEEGRDEELSDFELKKQEKQREVDSLKEKLAALKAQEDEKKNNYENVKAVLMELREKLKLIIEACKQLFAEFDEKRREAKAEKAKRIRELTDPNAAWGAEFGSPVEEVPVQSEEQKFSAETNDYIKYRALYEYEARNSDELGFKVGDIILVHPGQDHEPGWLGGELNGLVGWFPEAYVEKVDSGLQPIAEEESGGNSGSLGARVLYDWTSRQDLELSLNKEENVTVTSSTNKDWWYGMNVEGKQGYFPSNYVTSEHLEKRGITPIDPPLISDDLSSVPLSAPSTSAPKNELGNETKCVALYPYHSEEAGDLTFDQGDIIYVISQAEDWWTGRIGDRTGVFPFNYVEVVAAVEIPTTEAPFQPESIQENPTEINLPIQAAEPTSLVSDDGTVSDDKKQGVTWNESPSHVAHQVTKEIAVAATNITTTTSSSSPILVEGTGTAKRKTKKKKEEGEKGNKKPEIATVVAPYEATSKEQLSLQKGQMILIKKKNSSGWWQGEVQGGKGKKRQVGWFPANYVKVVGGQDKQPAAEEQAPASKEEKQTFRALFPYSANHEDELAFEAGDIITLISKEEEAWWKGECNGKVGVFPSNYVELIQYEEYGMSEVEEEEDPKRKGIINELFKTEYQYFENLKVVNDVFLVPLLSSSILCEEEVRAIFLNWKELMVKSNRFYKALKIRRKMTNGTFTFIGDILCESIPQMTCFIRYCASQMSAGNTLQKLLESRVEFAEFVKLSQMDNRVHGLPLSFYFLKPVKRVTEYPILIEKILHRTPVTNEDYDYMEEALMKARDLCEQVNEGMRQKENSERLEWIQIHVRQSKEEVELSFNSLTQFHEPRRILHAGVLHKKNKEILAILFNDFLLLTLPVSTKSFGPVFTTQFSFEKHRDVKLRIYKKPVFLNSLELITPRSSPQHGDEYTSENTLTLKSSNDWLLTVEALNVNDKTLWISHLNRAKEECRRYEDLYKAKKDTEVSEEQNSSVGRLLIIVEEARRLDFHEFLGRTEIRVEDILKNKKESMGPIQRNLPLHETTSGSLNVRMDVQLFANE